MQSGKSKRRIYITGFILLGVACFFIFKLSSLHFSDRIRLSTGHGEARRGRIMDRNGYILAMSVEKDSLFANPMKVERPAETAAAIAPVIGIAKDVLTERLSRKKQFVWLKRRLDDGESERLHAMKLPGIYFRKEMQRVYPHGKLAANIIGFVGLDNKGLAGIEYKYDSLLMGRDGGERDDEDVIPEGKSVVLTVDRFIQYQAEKGIEDSVRRFNARQGAVLVFEVKTGRVLAIGKYPSFDPNAYYRYSDVERNSYTVTDSFEPGSTLKIIAMALLLELFPDFNREFTCNGYVEVADTVINCIGVHGRVTPPDIIRHSCNAGVIQAMQAVQKKNCYDMLRRFGFGSKVGIELPGESEGILRPLAAWSGLSKYSTAIGQEISVTSLQLAAAFGAVGNGGVYMIPSIIEAIQREDGTVARSFYPRSRGRVITERTAQRLMSMMRLVVENGTGSAARIRFYIVFGKTGTGQKSTRQGGYSDRATASFIGLAPYEDPQICILVIVDEPAGNVGGGTAAAPVFAQVAERILPYCGIKTNPTTVSGAVRSTTERILFDGTTMPDLKGLSLSQSLAQLIAIQKRFAVTYSFQGSGRVAIQEPVPGTRIENKTQIRLHLKEE